MFRVFACLLITLLPIASLFFFFNDTATTEIYTLSLHDALPISPVRRLRISAMRLWCRGSRCWTTTRSEEHTFELQSRLHLVCRLLLGKKKYNQCAVHTLARPESRRGTHLPHRRCDRATQIWRPA